MGIPKFYRWLSERYPCISEGLVTDVSQVKKIGKKTFGDEDEEESNGNEYEEEYVPEPGEIVDERRQRSPKKKEKKKQFGESSGVNKNVVVIDNMYIDVNGVVHNCSHGEGVHRNRKATFHCIAEKLDEIIHAVNPRKLVFIAVDGPAPRAKANQQRARRYSQPLQALDVEKVFFLYYF